MSSNLETNSIDTLVREMVFGADAKDRQVQIRQMALEKNIFPTSIQSLYEEIGKGKYSGFTVPAMNLRGITYEMARAAFRAALKHNVGAFIFEIARSEMSYTLQTPGEYAGCVLAAAIAEGFEGPVFLQGDHIQIRRVNYAKEPRKELDFTRSLIKDLIDAGFYNIDIDASTLVDIDKADLVEQQKTNGLITAEMTRFIRLHQPADITISIGGEIGEIGSGNSTVEDLRAFMQVYNHDMAPGLKGISKISVQTGTTHGGVVLPNGRIADVQLDFDTLEKLSKLAREEYGMGGAVQHGASTLPDECFDIFPRIGTLRYIWPQGSKISSLTALISRNLYWRRFTPAWQPNMPVTVKATRPRPSSTTETASALSATSRRNSGICRRKSSARSERNSKTGSLSCTRS